MSTNLHIDDELIIKAVKLGGHSTERSAVTRALTEYISHLEQKKILSIFGTVNYESGYDYKKQRTRH